MIKYIFITGGVKDRKYHLIVAHEVTNVGSDREQLTSMAKQAREAMGVKELAAIADRGKDRKFKCASQ